MTADLYDFDKTVFPKDSATAYWLFCLKKNPVIIKHLPHQIISGMKFLLGRIDLSLFKQEFFCFVRSIDAVKEAEAFWDENGNKIYEWFEPDKNDVKTVVCSASPEFEIEPILKKLGADVIIGTKIDPVTGKMTGKNCKGKEKVERIKKEAGEFVFRNAYSDNPESDAPLLSLAENRYVIKKGKINKI